MLNQISDVEWGKTYSQISHTILGVPFDQVFLAPSTNGSQIKDYPNNTAGTAKYILRGGKSICMLVRNESSGALSPGEGVTLAFSSGFASSISGKHSATLPSIVHGLVDPFVTTVADDDYCMIIVAGICKFKIEVSGASPNISAGELLMPGGTTAGRFDGISTTPGSATIARNEAVSCVGYSLEATTTADALVLGVKYPQIYF